MSGPRVFWISGEDRLDLSSPSPVLYPGPPLSRHLVKSLRAAPGDIFSFALPDPPGSLFQGTVVGLCPFSVSLRQIPLERGGSKKRPFYIGVALLKGESWEDLIEPLVCLGARSLIPLMTDRSQIRWSQEQYSRKKIRFETKIREASQLSGRTDRMDLPPPVFLENLLETFLGSVLFFDEDPGARPVGAVLSSMTGTSPLLALIGPEGGWSSRERTFLRDYKGAKKSEPVSLGSLILPGRVAPIVAASLLSFCSEETSIERSIS